MTYLRAMVRSEGIACSFQKPQSPSALKHRDGGGDHICSDEGKMGGQEQGFGLSQSQVPGSSSTSTTHYGSLGQSLSLLCSHTAILIIKWEQ